MGEAANTFTSISPILKDTYASDKIKKLEKFKNLKKKLLNKKSK